jgi:arylsulfatase A-like enzyme
LDEAVGTVLATLRTHGLEENTLVVFLSDNGGPTAVTSARNDPLRGFKGQVLEGGIRIPFLMQWKGRLPAGRVYDEPVIALDLVPTIVAAAGGTISESDRLDGVNLLPYLEGARAGAPHDRLFWRFGPQAAVRMGDWKLVLVEGEEPMLFHLARDIGETTDLAAREPSKKAELVAAYQEWNAALMTARWGGRGGAPQRLWNLRP